MATKSTFRVLRHISAVLAAAVLAGGVQAQGGIPDPHLFGDSIAGIVHEFWNDQLKNYFFTATEIERQSINNGGSGPGWHETGFTFPSGGTSSSCRFRGTPGIGPNSHFYTIDPVECDNVKLDPGWTFESYDFSVSALGPDGNCPSGTQPVYRAYNKGFAQNNSNHRLTISLTAYNAQVAAGWSGEGIVMCASPGGAALSCSSTLSTSSISMYAAGGEESVAVAGGYGCPWTAARNVPWIIITSILGSAGDGNGSVEFSVNENTGYMPRTGTLTIAGAIFTVTQAGYMGY